MKRTKKTIEKRTFALKNAFPRFVSIVDRGANFIPLSELRFADENQQFADVEINRIEFAKATFDTSEAVDAYLQSNNFEQYEITETETGFLVANMEAEAFSEVQGIEYDDGVMYFIGKLKEEVADAPAAVVIESEVLEQHADAQETQEEVPEVNEETITASEDAPVGEDQEGSGEEVVQESQEEVVNDEAEIVTESEVEQSAEAEIADEIVTQSDEEVVPSRDDTILGFLSTAKFSSEYANFRSQIEDRKERGIPLPFDVVTYLFNDSCFSALYQNDMDQFKKNCNDYYKVINALVEATKNLAFNDEEVLELEEAAAEVVAESFSMTKDQLSALIEEKIEQFKQKTEIVVDETETLIQNSQRITSDEAIQVDDKSEQTKSVEKFNQSKTKDLFGIR